MRTLHIYCDFWEQSVSRALHELRRYDRYTMRISHIYKENMVEEFSRLSEAMGTHDSAILVVTHVDTRTVKQAKKLMAAISSTMRKRITICHSRYSPEIGRWADRLGFRAEVNEYEASRHAPWEPEEKKNGTSLLERRWIQYRLMRVLIAGECPTTVYGEILRKLRHGRLTEAEAVRAQRFYERGEPDMAGGNWAGERLKNPNIIDLLRERALQVGRSGLNTLIIGETGTGKESLAWYLHDFSTRCDKPFLALNCALFEGERLESELFGHELGAFTDAKRMKKGLVEEADSGTLFLDELPEMTLRVQAKLLRFLQDGTYTRLGGTKVMRSSVRVISAAQPERMSTLRQDLYYRVADVELHAVSLREMKPRDIVNIACNLAYRLIWRPIITAEGESILTPDIIRTVWEQLALPEHAAILSGYSWPGNMRELLTLIKRFVLLGDDIFAEIRGKGGIAAICGDDEWQRLIQPLTTFEEFKARGVSLNAVQVAFVRHVVNSLGGRDNIQTTKLAEALGCSYNTLKSCLSN